VSVKRNLIANYLGQGWTALMGMAFIPLYIRYLGIEAYGLIGIFALLQAWLSLLDLGITPTLGREMARFTGGAHAAKSVRDLLRSIEIVALVLACLIAAGIWLMSTWLATGWLHADKLPVAVVAHAFDIMGVVTALRFLEGIYRSSIVGLQRQVLYNAINASMATLRWMGAVAVLAWVSPTIEMFFLWQGFASLLTLLLFARATYAELPCASGGRFSLATLKNLGRFAGGIASITFLGLLLTQIDKILLSRLLVLGEYGYYTMATVVSGGLYMLVVPVIQAYYPHLSQLYASGDQAQLIKSYHRSAQMVSVVVGSAAAVLMVFSETILTLWTQNAGLASRTALLLSILCLGNLLNCLMWIPYQTQLAYGWTSLSVTVNIALVVFIVPAIFWATPRFGAQGAAWSWVALNVWYILFDIHFMHRRILRAEKRRWYIHDVAFPLAAASAVSVTLAWLMPKQMAAVTQIAYLVVASGLTLLVAALTVPDLRISLRLRILQRFKWQVE
jgi:O-antigen/teichoic acid export membrane protein